MQVSNTASLGSTPASHTSPHTTGSGYDIHCSECLIVLGSMEGCDAGRALHRFICWACKAKPKGLPHKAARSVDVEDLRLPRTTVPSKRPRSDDAVADERPPKAKRKPWRKKDGEVGAAKTTGTQRPPRVIQDFLGFNVTKPQSSKPLPTDDSTVGPEKFNHQESSETGRQTFAPSKENKASSDNGHVAGDSPTEELQSKTQSTAVQNVTPPVRRLRSGKVVTPLPSSRVSSPDDDDSSSQEDSSYQHYASDEEESAYEDVPVSEDDVEAEHEKPITTKEAGSKVKFISKTAGSRVKQTGEWQLPPFECGAELIDGRICQHCEDTQAEIKQHQKDLEHKDPVRFPCYLMDQSGKPCQKCFNNSECKKMKNHLEKDHPGPFRFICTLKKGSATSGAGWQRCLYSTNVTSSWLKHVKHQHGDIQLHYCSSLQGRVLCPYYSRSKRQLLEHKKNEHKPSDSM